MTYLIAYAATAFVFLLIDFIWLGTIATGFYKSQLGDKMADPVNLPIAALFYLFYAAGIVYFAVKPALEQGNLGLALLNGAILGLLAYGTYDITNMATLKDWPVKMSIVDMAWGVFITAFSALAGTWITRFFL